MADSTATEHPHFAASNFPSSLPHLLHIQPILTLFHHSLTHNSFMALPAGAGVPCLHHLDPGARHIQWRPGSALWQSCLRQLESVLRHEATCRWRSGRCGVSSSTPQTQAALMCPCLLKRAGLDHPLPPLCSVLSGV